MWAAKEGGGECTAKKTIRNGNPSVQKHFQTSFSCFLRLAQIYSQFPKDLSFPVAQNGSIDGYSSKLLG